MTDDAWWVQRPGSTPEGPFTAEEIRRMILQRKLDRRTMVWSRATAIWRNLRDQFPSARPERPAGPFFWGALALQVLFFLASTGLALALVYGGAEADDTDIAIVEWAGVGACLLIATLGGFALWGRVVRSLLSAPELGAGLRVARVLLLIGGATLAGVEINVARFAIPARIAADQWRFHAVADAGRRRIRIEGGIGPAFGARVEALVDRAAPHATLEITSTGGLTNEALRAAHALERRPDIAVIARGQCASACLIVLMGAKTRLADVDMALQFHAAASVIETSDRFQTWVSAKAGREADDYLRRRGVAESIIVAKNRAGPSYVYEVPATEARRMGVLTGLVEGDRVLTDAEIQSSTAASQARAAIVAAP